MKIDNSISFNVDHSKLTRGIYLSSIDNMANMSTVTIDMRMRVPYKEEVISNEEMHTFEHCFATAVRNVAENIDNVSVAYFGPMGCQTGYYLVLNFVGIPQNKYFNIISRLIADSCQYIENMFEVPAKNPIQCGNYHTLGGMSVALKAEEELKELSDEISRQDGFHQYVYIKE